MTTSGSFLSALEDLPDEVLLLICRYLSSIDILFSFYDLNSRLNQTISDFCRHVALARVPFARFNYICESILPDIGANITSFTIDNEWIGVLSKIFLNQFGENLSLVFPRLKQITLNAFMIKFLLLFLDCLQDLTELLKITIHGVSVQTENSNELQTLLPRIFVANNNRLNSVKCETYAIGFPVDLKDNDLIFSNIEILHIHLKTIDDLHRLLTVLSGLRYLNAKIYEDSIEFSKQNQYITIPSLKSLRLQSFYHSLNLDEFASVIKRIPNIEELSIGIDSYNDISLLDGHQIFSLLSGLSLKTFNYFVRLEDSSSIDHTKIISTWQQFNQEFVYVKEENENRLVLYTLPFLFHDLIFRCSLAKQQIFSEHYAPQVQHLYIHAVPTHISEVFPIISKSRQLNRLCLKIDVNLVSKPCEQDHLWKLSCLTRIMILGRSSIDNPDFQKLLERSPNVYDLSIYDELLHRILNDESLCHIVQHRITHLCITISSSNALESIISSVSRLASMLSSLKHLYIWIEKNCQGSELLIETVLKYLSIWNCLISFITVGIIIKPEILAKGIRQWVLDNSLLSNDDLFIADYSDERFRLWL